ncbi:M3 family oligoendopeptidase [Herpetosiphon sp. NSE202]|uniref:M3 family oligoendopeptidase n=1 Tax=Herpetosiphon sp. NSE202 TaxID=3351349 RepID=UPI003629F2A8
MTTQTLPHWDLSVVYPSLESPEFAEGFEKLKHQVAELKSLFDQNAIQRSENQVLDSTTIATFATVTNALNQAHEAVATTFSYIMGFVATDTRNTVAQARFSEMQQLGMQLQQLGIRWVAWIGGLDVEQLIAQSPLAADHAYALQKAKQEATHLMSPAEEVLAAELNLSGANAWSKLHTVVSSQLNVPVEIDGETKHMPMSMVRNLAFDPNREVRKSAYEAELAGWKQVETPLAGAINSIKGQVNTLAGHRGWATALDEALADNNIDRQTLDAMLTAARETFPDFRRYLQAKARLLGSGDRLPWFDLFAPIGNDVSTWEYAESEAFILEHFGSYSQRLRDYAARAFDENWIDAEPRAGKRDGAFCMRLVGDESRILSNYKPSFAGMRTLAHELGHGYHNLNLAAATPLQRQIPMTLAETASIFCETIVRNAALAKADPATQLAIIESSLQNSCQLVVDISSRFIFEQSLFEARQARELSVQEINDLMLKAQAETYGDGLDEQYYHQYMWAVKGHYYSAERSFYNYPYMFGLLFGLGLYAQYVATPDEFRAKYDDLLAASGKADAATLAERFGIDIRTPDFWRASLATVKADIDRFVELSEQLLDAPAN